MAALLATHRGLLLFTSTTVCERLFGSLSAGFVPLSMVKERLGLHLYNNSPFMWHNNFGVGWKYVFFQKWFAVLTTFPSCYGFYRSDLLRAQLRWSSGLKVGVWKGHSEHWRVPFLTLSFKGKWLFLLYSVWVSVLFIGVKCGCDCGHTHTYVLSVLWTWPFKSGTSPRVSEFHFSLNWDWVYVGTRCLGVWLLNCRRTYT